jgi:hypothetical protein
MAFDPAAVGSTFHLTVPTESLPTSREVLDARRTDNPDAKDGIIMRRHVWTSGRDLGQRCPGT